MSKKKKVSSPERIAASQENGKLGGQPKKWNEESLDELADSLDSWIDNAIKNKSEFWWWDWCQEVGVNQSRIVKLAEQSPRFRRSYENAKHWQESIVARFALTKKFSDGFSKFFLINHYPDRWKDKTSDSAKREDLIEDLEKFFEERKSGTPIQPGMAPQQPISHQRCSRQENLIQDELGTARSF